jgi:hypothetical protein
MGTMDDESLARLVAVTGPAGSSNGALAAAVAGVRSAAAGSCGVILVEGVSDQAAVEALAARRGQDLRRDGVFVVPMGGATNIGHFLDLFGPRGLGVRLAGLCDEGEESDFRRGLTRTGLGPVLSRDDLEGRGFYVCVADLEDELIRSLGTAAIELIFAAEGELGSFRILCQQPAQRDRTREQQVKRFIGSRARRKIRYGRILTEALDPARVPRPLARVLSQV